MSTTPAMSVKLQVNRKEETLAERVEIAEVVAGELDKRVIAVLEPLISGLREKVEANSYLLSDLLERARTSEAEIHHLREKLIASESETGRLRELLRSSETEITRLQEGAREGEAAIAHLHENARVSEGKIAVLEENAKRIDTYLDNTQRPPVAPPPVPPVIDTVPLPTRDRYGRISLSLVGTGFAPSDPENRKKVRIRVACSDGSTLERIGSTSPSGTLIAPPIWLEAQESARTYRVDATDGSPNPRDWTGELWSNSVTFLR